MQLASLFPDTRLEDVHRRLLNHYGQPEPRDLWDPLTQMIYSMLSSRTKTPVSHAVLAALKARFGTWENLRDAPIPEIEDTIRPVTFPEPKAINLKAALVRVTERHGSLNLSFLARHSTEKIRIWLEKFEGVGVKTSAAVVNFSTLRRRAMCVDSHHLRIVQRLGFVNKSATAREAETRIMEMAPAIWSAAMLDDHHSLIKLHGQKCCTKNDPRCSRCPLRDICPAATI
ncbi:endonuclease III domain-containing protein [Granulicella aggregans]|jgi:endonuclease-3|uniref:endonuclease III domain-containing protein n=1 Tax=Granulicella aggregans TaxID=474949 RepID=UPI0021DFC1C7|nr:iron-sulfur cluster loop [Granulicella aggregans]